MSVAILDSVSSVSSFKVFAAIRDTMALHRQSLVLGNSGPGKVTPGGKSKESQASFQSVCTSLPLRLGVGGGGVMPPTVGDVDVARSLWLPPL
jgi:hypothetical protein